MRRPELGQLLVSKLRVSAAGPLTPGEVWPRYAEYRRWPTWSPQVRRVETALDRLTAGAEGRVVGPLGVSVRFEVISLDETEHRWTWAVHAGPVTVRLEHGLDPGPDGRGTRAWLVLHGPTPVVAGYAPPAWYALHRLVTLPVSG